MRSHVQPGTKATQIDILVAVELSIHYSLQSRQVMGLKKNV